MADVETFERTVQVRFRDCDPAGIVFYPRYFEMFNNLVEDWCEHGLGASFKELIQVRGFGLPAVSITTDFLVPSTLGDQLRATLSVVAVGTSSITTAVHLVGQDGIDRVRATLVLVLMDLKTSRATPLPDEMRLRVARFGPPEQAKS